MQNQSALPTLETPNAQAGLALACKLADQLQTQMETVGARFERPGGMNYLLPGPVPREVVAGILFYAIAVANGGWAGKV